MLISEIMHSKALETTHWCVLKRYSCQLPQWVSLSFYTSRLFNKMLVSCSPFMGHEKKNVFMMECGGRVQESRSLSKGEVL